ncbi:MAG TPA: ABC transporter ATP-binding protein [Pseudonocardia sp.]|nr:ABC transporter ATP-binding protein [Pseudonocardia sp.]
MTESPLLEVSGLCAGYGAVQVLWDVELTVAEGELVAIIGPNGAGKSTLLRALSGIIPISAGSATFRGRPLGGVTIERIAGMGLAHVPEGRRLFPGMTVRDNLRLGGWRHGRAGAGDQDLERVLELFPALRDRLRQVVGSMSGGEQQMCAVARGLMSRPDLLMIDELSLGLAPVIVEEIMGRLPRIAAEGTAVLLVDQDVEQALTVAGRGYVLETGHVALSGESGTLLADPGVRRAYLGIA